MDALTPGQKPAEPEVVGPLRTILLAVVRADPDRAGAARSEWEPHSALASRYSAASQTFKYRYAACAAPQAAISILGQRSERASVTHVTEPPTLYVSRDTTNVTPISPRLITPLHVTFPQKPTGPPSAWRSSARTGDHRCGPGCQVTQSAFHAHEFTGAQPMC